MTRHVQKRGPDVTRDQLSKICAILGYDASDVREINLTGSGPVHVTTFLRVPMPGFERGMRINENGPGSPYAVAHITHGIANSTPSDTQVPAENGDQADAAHPISDERLAAVEGMARRGTLELVEVLELTTAIRRLKESR